MNEPFRISRKDESDSASITVCTSVAQTYPCPFERISSSHWRIASSILRMLTPTPRMLVRGSCREIGPVNSTVKLWPLIETSLSKTKMKRSDAAHREDHCVKKNREIHQEAAMPDVVKVV